MMAKANKNIKVTTIEKDKDRYNIAVSNIKKYNLFIMISTIARNIVEVFSSVLLYKMGYSLKEILLFFTILYLIIYSL